MAADDFVRVQITEADITYGVLEELLNELLADDDDEYEQIIDSFLGRFADRAALLQWGAAFVNSDADELHARWSMDHPDAEDYTTKRVTAILEGDAS